MHLDIDWEDPAAVAGWLHEQREQVCWYLQQVQADCHAPPAVAWHVAPYVALWQCRLQHEDHALAWVISGDLPTDAIIDDSIEHPRDALQAFGDRFVQRARVLLGGRVPPEFENELGDCTRERLAELGEMLMQRGGLLQDTAYEGRNW